MNNKYDLAIIGAGPGGYVAAIRAAQLRKRVVLIEKEKLGGTCMNCGCIPTKYLLHETEIYKELKENKNVEIGGVLSLNWKRTQEEKKRIVQRLIKGIDFLLKKNWVEVIKGKGILEQDRKVVVYSKEEKKVLEAEKIILATGSRPAEFSFLRPNGKKVITSEEALDLEYIPKEMLIIGAGAIGLEIGSIFQRVGCKVSILEIMPTILPGSDNEIVSRLEKILKRQGLNIYTKMRIEECRHLNGKVSLKGISLDSNTPFEFQSEMVLMAAGRRPNSEFIVENTDIYMDKGKYVKVNQTLETSVKGVYAIGDLIGGKLLAHKASHEGIVAAENSSGITGIKREMNYKALPSAVYTYPEFSSVGITEEEARKKGMKVQVGVFSLQANGRALTMGSSEGLAKIIAGERDEIIGAHILSPNASELIAELTLAVENEMTLKDVSSCIHIHPTLSEAVMEAAMNAKKEAIHTIN